MNFPRQPAKILEKREPKYSSPLWAPVPLWKDQLQTPKATKYM